MIVVLLPVLVLLVVVATSTDPGPVRHAAARDVLDRRLAAGEIDPAEHHERCQALDPDRGGRRSWRPVAVGAAALLVVAGLVVTANWSMEASMGQMMNGTAGMGGFGWIWMVVFTTLVVGGIVWAVGRLSPDARSDGQDARRLLDERFAQGEIDGDEYAQRRDALR